MTPESRTAAVHRLSAARRWVGLLLLAALAGCSAHRDRVEALPAHDPLDVAPSAAVPRDDGTAGAADADAAPPAREADEPARPPETHVVAPGETLWRIARRHGLSAEELARANGIGDPARIAVGRRLVIPGRADAPPGSDVPAPADAGTAPDGLLPWPVEGRVSSRFGAPRGRRVHKGVDILVPDGTPVVAVDDGTVRFAGWRGAYGRLVIVDHDTGLASYYAHNSKLLVREGERVGRGQPIAASGRSGNATAPHLHFELRVSGTPVDPLDHFAP